MKTAEIPNLSEAIPHDNLPIIPVIVPIIDTVLIDESVKYFSPKDFTFAM